MSVIDTNLEISTTYNSVKLCRACLGDREDMQDIFQTCFSDIFVYCTALEVSEDDGLPSSVCRNCVALLNTFYYFKQQCIRSDGTLRQIIIPQVPGNIKQEDTIVEIKYDMKFDLVGEVTNTQNFVTEEERNHYVENFDCEDNLFYDQKSLECDLASLSLPNQEHLANKVVENVLSRQDSTISVDHQYITVNKKKVSFENQVSQYKCEICCKGFTKTTLLRKHVKEKHFEGCKRKQKCKPLPKATLTELIVKKPLFKCPKCDKRFKLSHRLDAHVREHYGLKPFDCKICHKELSNWRTLKMHMNRHSGQRNYVCNICKKAFTYPTVLEIHKKIHLGIKNYHCDVCNASFIQSGQLKSHMRTHTSEQPYRCTLCDKSFKSSSILKTHVERHNGIRNFVCSICGKRFPTSGELTTHTRSHTNEKPFSCITCQKKFKTRSLLAVHNRIHTGERPYKCESCPKEFVTSQMLKRHSLVHSGIKPHVCELCHRGFTQKSTLKTHMKSHEQILQGVRFETLKLK